MLKKVLTIILILAIAGAGGFGTYHFYTENKNNMNTLQQTQSQLAQAQSELSAIGTMTYAYSVATNVLSGEVIDEGDLVEVYIPTSAVGDTVIADAETAATLVGKRFRCNYSAGTLMTKEMVMTDSEEVEGITYYPIELTFTALPVTLAIGDQVSIRFLLANGEEYVVLSHKIVRDIYNNTIQLYINEEENAIIKSLLNDLGVYNCVCTAYLYKYLEPGNTDDLAFYPVVTEMEDFLYYNPNITDPTRCINSNLREHINQQLILLSDSANSGTANLVISSVGSQLSASDTMRQDWVQKQQQAEESGEVVSESGETTEETTEAEVDTEAID